MSFLDNVRQQLAAAKLIPVVRTDTAESALWAARLLIEEGFRVIEITDTIPQSETVMKTLGHEFPEILLGAGTVLTKDAVRRLTESGAEFLVSPVFDEALFTYCQGKGLIMIPGAMTPTEIYRAHSLGASMVKIFPVSSVGGASYVRSLKDVFPQIQFIPTGGISEENLTAHLDAGALAVGLGQNLLPADAVLFQDEERIRSLARRYQQVLSSGSSALETANRII